MSDITDIDDVISSANRLPTTFSGDVIDDADLSASPYDSLSYDLSRYIHCEPVLLFYLILAVEYTGCVRIKRANTKPQFLRNA